MLEEKTEKEKIEEEEIIRTFGSILKNGICPLSALSIEDSFPNPTLGVRQVMETVSVNYINFTHSWMTQESKNNIIKIATFDEYTGIYGIPLERRWPFQSVKKNKISLAEISQRLCASVVFVLNAKQADIQKQIEIIGLQKKSSARKDPLVGTKIPQDIYTENSIIEIKTPHVFPLEEWLAVLVPQPLVDLATSIFKGKVQIIPVPIKTIKLNKLPDILKFLHLETLGAPTEAAAPQYDKILKEFIEKEKLTEFLLHAVRLNTPLDFNYWYFDDLKNHQKLISKLRGKIVQKNTSESGWVKFHKSLATQTTRQGLEKTLSKVFEDILAANRSNQQSYLELLKVKKSQITTEKRHIYGKLPAEKIGFLESIGVQILPVHGYWILAFSKSFTPKVEEIINKNPKELKAKLKNESTKVLQSAIRAALSSTTLFKIIKKQEQIITLQREIIEMRQNL
jgi:hypothetical protein